MKKCTCCGGLGYITRCYQCLGKRWNGDKRTFYCGWLKTDNEMNYLTNILSNCPLEDICVSS